jgi:hypothetical protein
MKKYGQTGMATFFLLLGRIIFLPDLSRAAAGLAALMPRLILDLHKEWVSIRLIDNCDYQHYN